MALAIPPRLDFHLDDGMPEMVSNFAGPLAIWLIGQKDRLVTEVAGVSGTDQQLLCSKHQVHQVICACHCWLLYVVAIWVNDKGVVIAHKCLT